MLKPEQVPNAVVDALWSATGDHPVGVLSSRYEAKLYLAAAINSWPGMQVRLNYFQPTEEVILPLQEPRT